MLNAGAFGDVLLASLGHGLIEDLAISFEAVQVRHTASPQVHDASRYAAQCTRAPANHISPSGGYVVSVPGTQGSSVQRIGGVYPK